MIDMLPQLSPKFRYRKTMTKTCENVQIGSPQRVQLEKLRRQSCRTEALLKTAQEAAWDFHQTCGEWWSGTVATGTWPTHGLADSCQIETIQTTRVEIRHCY